MYAVASTPEISNISPCRDHGVTAIPHAGPAVNITPSSPLRLPSSCKVDSLLEAAAVALRTSGPLKVWRLTERGRHELYFYRDLVIHAHAEGHCGVEAVRRMLTNHAQAFTLEQGRWPAQHTMLVGWPQVLASARTKGPTPQNTLQPVRYADEG